MAAGWAASQSFIWSANPPPSWRLMALITTACVKPADAAPDRNLSTASSPHSTSPTGMICRYLSAGCRDTNARAAKTGCQQDAGPFRALRRPADAAGGHPVQARSRPTRPPAANGGPAWLASVIHARTCVTCCTPVQPGNLYGGHPPHLVYAAHKGRQAHPCMRVLAAGGS